MGAVESVYELREVVDVYIGSEELSGFIVWLGVIGLVIGVFAMIGAFMGGGVGSFIFGLINFVIGLLLLGAPMVAALAVPLVFGILLLIQGVILIIWAFKVRE